MKSKLQQMMIVAHTRHEMRGDDDFRHNSANGYARISADGSFRITGVQPGKVTIKSQEMMPGSKLIMARTERNGADVSEGMNVLERENVTGVRVVFGLGNCVIRGQATVTGGKLPDGWRMMVFAHRDKSGGRSVHGVSEVDGKGRFVIEGLLSGEYTLSLTARPPPNPNSPDQPQTPKPVTKQVAMASGAEVQVTMTLDLSRKNEEERQ